MPTRKPKSQALATSPARLARGRAREDARFTAVAPAGDMQAFAAAGPNGAIVQEALAQIGWYQNIALLDKLETTQERLRDAHQLPRNLNYMCAVASAWLDGSIVQRVVARSPWKENISL